MKVIINVSTGNSDWPALKRELEFDGEMSDQECKAIADSFAVAVKAKVYELLGGKPDLPDEAA